MLRAKKEALEITAKLVEAKLNNSTLSINAENGKAVAEYFQAIYDKVEEIAEKVYPDNT